jgi:hypothetical protein
VFVLYWEIKNLHFTGHVPNLAVACCTWTLCQDILNSFVGVNDHYVKSGHLDRNNITYGRIVSNAAPQMERTPVALSADRILSAIRRIWRRSDLSEIVVGSLSRNPSAAQEGIGLPSNDMVG